MFKLHKPHLSGSIHSGHFMVSRLDDDDEDNNDPDDDSSESERDNANSVEIDVNNPESVVDATNLAINYRVRSPSTKNDKLTSWNDLDRPANHSQHQYLTYYTNSYGEDATASSSSHQITGTEAGSSLSPLGHTGVITDRIVGSNGVSVHDPSKDLLPRGFNSHLNHLHQHHHIQDTQLQQQHHLHQQQHHHYNLNQHNHNHHQLAQLDGQQQHHPHAVTIDTSLTKLLECMSLYYSCKLTSPKWKSFKGLKLRLKYKIRLNNLIWRAWFLQYIRGRRPPGCQFTAPVETDVHNKSESIVLEGKYWKRKEKAIVDEYKKWRIFHKQKSQMHCFRPSSFDWDSRASNLASSSMYGPGYNFYPDYDMSITYNLDDLPPMLEDLDTREIESCYPSQPPMRMIETQQQPQQQSQLPPQQLLPQQQQQLQQQQQQQQQQHQQQQPHHHHHQQQQQVQQQPSTKTVAQASQSQQPKQLSLQHHQLSQHHQQQLTQMPSSQTNTNTSNNSQQALSLKRENPLLASSSAQAGGQQVQSGLNHQQLATQQHHIHSHHPQTSHSQVIHNQRASTIPFNFNSNPFYQQINDQLHQQQQQLTAPSVSPLLVQQQQQESQSQHQDAIMSIGQSYDHHSESSGGSVRSEQRRVCHINAEQKRRCNIKNGFDTLKSILPSINQNVNVKISKASMLQKAALHISALSAEQKQQAEEQALLKQQIEGLKQTITVYQSQLPAAGGPVGCQGSSQSREMLQDYVRRRTLENWKFWIFSLIIEPLFESYHSSVSTTSLEDACKTIFTWLDRSCGLVSLRKDVLESLTFLSTSTNILNTPQTLPTEAVDAVRYQSGGQASSAHLTTPSLMVSGPSRQQQEQQQQQQHHQPQSQPHPQPQQLGSSTQQQQTSLAQAHLMQSMPSHAIRDLW